MSETISPVHHQHIEEAVSYHFEGHPENTVDEVKTLLGGIATVATQEAGVAAEESAAKEAKDAAPGTVETQESTYESDRTKHLTHKISELLADRVSVHPHETTSESLRRASRSALEPQYEDESDSDVLLRQQAGIVMNAMLGESKDEIPLLSGSIIDLKLRSDIIDANDGLHGIVVLIEQSGSDVQQQEYQAVAQDQQEVVSYVCKGASYEKDALLKELVEKGDSQAYAEAILDSAASGVDLYGSTITICARKVADTSKALRVLEEKNDYSSIGQNLDIFPSVDRAVLAEKLMESADWGTILQNIDELPVDKKQAIDGAIEDGYAYEVARVLDKLPIDKVELYERAKETGDWGSIAMAISELDPPREELLTGLIGQKSWSSIAENISELPISADDVLIRMMSDDSTKRQVLYTFNALIDGGADVARVVQSVAEVDPEKVALNLDEFLGYGYDPSEALKVITEHVGIRASYIESLMSAGMEPQVLFDAVKDRDVGYDSSVLIDIFTKSGVDPTSLIALVNPASALSASSYETIIDVGGDTATVFEAIGRSENVRINESLLKKILSSGQVDPNKVLDFLCEDYAQTKYEIHSLIVDFLQSGADPHKLMHILVENDGLYKVFDSFEQFHDAGMATSDFLASIPEADAKYLHNTVSLILDIDPRSADVLLQVLQKDGDFSSIFKEYKRFGLSEKEVFEMAYSIFLDDAAGVLLHNNVEPGLILRALKTDPTITIHAGTIEALIDSGVDKQEIRDLLLATERVDALVRNFTRLDISGNDLIEIIEAHCNDSNLISTFKQKIGSIIDTDIDGNIVLDLMIKNRMNYDISRFTSNLLAKGADPDKLMGVLQRRGDYWKLLEHKDVFNLDYDAITSVLKQEKNVDLLIFNIDVLTVSMQEIVTIAAEGQYSNGTIANNIDLFINDENVDKQALLSVMVRSRAWLGIIEHHDVLLPDAMRIDSLTDLISDGGAFSFMKEVILEEVFNADNPDAIIAEYEKINDAAVSNWFVCIAVAERQHGMERFKQSSDLMLDRLPHSMPLAYNSDYIPQENFYTSSPEETVDLMRLYGVQEDVVQAYQESGEVSIRNLPIELVEQVVATQLHETLTMSRDQKSRQEMEGRNSQYTYQDIIQPGTLIHNTRTPQIVSLTLQNGCLPGEFLGQRSTLDATPLAADFVGIPDEAVDTLGSLANDLYGGIRLHFIRSDESVRPRQEYNGGRVGPDHRLVSGGLPSTELSGVTLLDTVSPEDVEELKRTFVRNALFVPIFDINGEKVFGYQDYIDARHENNYDVVEPRPVDRAVRQPGSQSGSNEGAVYVFPGGSRNYVKFSSGDNEGHLWNEILADSLYRAVEPELVPETEAVFIEGRMARSSQLVPLDPEAQVNDEARNAGFVMDCLLGNWDVVYNSNNLIMSGGRAMRIDTGNALTYKARGDRKDDGTFGPEVRELNVGSDRERLGEGMRQMYPGLSDSQIEQQVLRLRDRLTDDVIDKLVNSVVLPSQERGSLMEVLKKRRDYIVAWAGSIEKAA